MQPHGLTVPKKYLTPKGVSNKTDPNNNRLHNHYYLVGSPDMVPYLALSNKTSNEKTTHFTH